MSETDFRLVADFVSERAGISFATMRPGFVEGGIRRAAKKAGIADISSYLATLAIDESRFLELMSELTVSETYFFREPAQFGFVRGELLPELTRARPTGHRVRAWSAGCASGEEAYSLAILFEQAGIADHWPILATDLSASALRKARRGVYGAWSFRGQGADLTDTYFRRRGNGLEILERFRDRVTFRVGNLLNSWPKPLRDEGLMDLVLCRNVLIYFRADAIAQVAANLWSALAEDGWLLTGASDPPLTEFAPFEVVVTRSGVHYRRKARFARVRPASRASAKPLPEPIMVAPTPPRPPAPVVLKRTEPSIKTPPSATIEDYEGRIRAFRSEGDAQAAKRESDEAIAKFPTACSLHFLRAMLLLDLGELEEAARASRRAIYLDRNLAMGHLALGTILERMGEADQASRAYRSAWSLLAARPSHEVVAFSENSEAGFLAEVARARFQSLQVPGRGLPP
jgi:chemotaxis protein methyltransferase CheR